MIKFSKTVGIPFFLSLILLLLPQSSSARNVQGILRLEQVLNKHYLTSEEKQFIEDKLPRFISYHPNLEDLINTDKETRTKANELIH